MVDQLKCKKANISREFDNLQVATAEQGHDFIKTQIQLAEAKKSIKNLTHHSRKIAEDKKHAEARWAWEKSDKIKSINKSYAQLTAALVQLKQPTIRRGWNLLLRKQNWSSNKAEATNCSLSIFAKLAEQRKNSAIFNIRVLKLGQILDEFSLVVGHKSLYVSLVNYTWPPYFDKTKMVYFNGTLQIWDQTSKTIDQFNVNDVAVTNLANQPNDNVLVLNHNIQRPSRLSSTLFAELSDVFEAIIKPDWLLFNYCK